MTNKCLFKKLVAGNGRSKMNVNMCDKDPRGKNQEEVVAGVRHGTMLGKFHAR